MKKPYLFSIGIIVLAGIVGNLLRFHEIRPDRLADFANIPLQSGSYFGQEYVLSEATAEVLKADIATNRAYASPDGTAYQLFIAYFNSQKYGSQIHSPKHCLPGGGWRIEGIRPFSLKLPGGISKSVNLAIISAGESKIAMFYWFETRSGAIRDEYGLKLDLAKNALLFNPSDAAIIRLTVDVRGRSMEEATKLGVEFLNYFYPAIEKSLPF